MYLLEISLPQGDKNRLFQILNFIFFGVMLVFEGFYMYSWRGDEHPYLVLIGVFRSLLQFLEKIILLSLTI